MNYIKIIRQISIIIFILLINTSLLIPTVFAISNEETETQLKEIPNYSYASLYDDKNRYTFNCKEYETENKFFYYGARHYTSDISPGRFTTTDPEIGDFYNPQRLNRYVYGLNNPIRYVDRDGKDAEEANPPADSLYVAVRQRVRVDKEYRENQIGEIIDNPLCKRFRFYFSNPELAIFVKKYFEDPPQWLWHKTWGWVANWYYEGDRLREELVKKEPDKYKGPSPPDTAAIKFFAEQAATSDFALRDMDESIIIAKKIPVSDENTMILTYWFGFEIRVTLFPLKEKDISTDNTPLDDVDK